MIRADGDRRWRRVYLSPQRVLDLFMDWEYRPECMTQLTFEGVPSDYVIDGLFFDEMEMAFVFILYHPTFEVVAFGDLSEVVKAVERPFFLPACKSRDEAVRLSKLAQESDNGSVASDDGVKVPG